MWNDESEMYDYILETVFWWRLSKLSRDSEFNIPLASPILDVCAVKGKVDKISLFLCSYQLATGQ